MIILITGASHTGKTLLAQRMLENCKYPYLSIDHLKMGLIRSGNTDLTPEDDDKLTEYLWPIVREIMKTTIENRQNLVNPDRLFRNYGDKNVRIVGIVTGVADESDFPPKTEEPFLAQVFEEELKEFERENGSR